MKIKGESPFFLLLQHGHVEGKKRFGSIISRLGAWPSGNTVMQRPRCPRNKMSAILVLASKASSYQAGKRMCSPVLLGTLVSAPPLAAEYTWQGEGRGSPRRELWFKRLCRATSLDPEKYAPASV